MLDRVGPLALDGPVASGKSSVGRNIANRLGWVFADTGLMYRAIGYLMSLHEIKSGASKNLLEMAHSATIDISDEQVVLNGETITPHIRSPEIANNASIAAESSEIRNLLVSQQRELASKTRGKIVMVGRDITTIVIPNAPYKFFLDAPSSIRAQRRLSERIETTPDLVISEVLKDIDKRDKRDRERNVSPLTLSPGTTLINTEDLSLESVVEKILTLIENPEGA
jgi:cytidylate kinase